MSDTRASEEFTSEGVKGVSCPDRVSSITSPVPGAVAGGPGGWTTPSQLGDGGVCCPMLLGPRSPGGPSVRPDRSRESGPSLPSLPVSGSGRLIDRRPTPPTVVRAY